MPASVYVHYKYAVQRPEEGVGFSGIEFTGGCEPGCILGTEPGSSEQVASAVNHGVISPAPM